LSGRPDGKAALMTTLHVLPRPTPEERAEVEVDIQVDEGLSVLAATIEDWVAHRQGWDLTLHEGHDFGRPNNVEARLLFSAGEQTSTLVFRLEQLDEATDTGQELVLLFEKQDGIAKLARLRPAGLDLELFHILTFT
jgi:hypothetical protein